MTNKNNEDWEDPIVAEVRAVREAHARKFNYDLDAIFNDIVQRQKQGEASGIKYVSRPRKRRGRLEHSDKFVKVNYSVELDSLYLVLSEECINSINDSKEVYPGVSLDFDSCGKVVGINLNNASSKLDIEQFERTFTDKKTKSDNK